MTQTIAHRGPDDAGLFVAEGIALGHRRLSILDLSSTGAQPMSLGATTVVYNGEAYNFRQLRFELERLGHAFLGSSDTEVLLHAYREWGLQGLERLEGIFAFGLWDAARRRLVLMRDRLGIKPLYYGRDGARLAFGSEIKAVLAGINVDRTVDEQALAEYLWYGNAFEERTIYRGVRALGPGCRLVVDDGGQRVESWWRVESWLDTASVQTTRVEAAHAVRDALDTAVARQLVSDVPVGLFLSGGIDSSSIAASVALAAGRRVSSFSVGFDYDPAASELAKARLVAERLGLDHHEVHIRGDDLEETIELLVHAHDEPFGDAANIPLFLLARQLRGSIKVVLQGDGGDELFGGYRRYTILRSTALWRLWPQWLGSVMGRSPGLRAARLARMGSAAGHPDPALRMALLLTVENLRDPPTALFAEPVRQRFEAATDPFLAFRKCAGRFSHAEPVQRMLLTDLTLQLPSQFLAKVDRATMAQGLEARVPLLDEGVASLAVRLPSSLKVARAQKKIVLRDAMRGRLPTEVLDAPKRGFGVPYEQWLRTSLFGYARSVLLQDDFIARFGLERSRLEHALMEHRAGTRDRGFTLWKMLQLALWSKQYG